MKHALTILCGAFGLALILFGWLAAPSEPGAPAPPSWVRVPDAERDWSRPSNPQDTSPGGAATSDTSRVAR